MFNLAYRNLRLFFKQKSMVFFSLLGVFVILGLYTVFLGDIWLLYADDLPEAVTLLNTWIVAGVTSVASITTSMGATAIVVEDKVKRNIKDFYAAPLARWKIIGGYLLSIFAVGFLMSLICFVLGEGYIVMNGGALLPPRAMLQMLGVILLSVTASGSLVFFIISFVSGVGAYNTISTLIGTLIGFLTGIYLPIGTLPEAVQGIIKFFPVSHASALMRRVMMRQPLAESFAGIPDTYVTEFEQLMGLTYVYGDYTATAGLHIAVLAGTAVVFYLLALLNYTKGTGRRLG